MSLAATWQAATFFSGAPSIAMTVVVWMPMAPFLLARKSVTFLCTVLSAKERGLQPLSFSTILSFFLAASPTSADARPDGKEMGYRDRMAWTRGA